MTPTPLPDFAIAWQQLLAAARRVKGVDHVPLAEALGRVLAEPVAAAAEVLAAGTVLTAPAIEVAASLGRDTLPVRRRLSVALLSAGTPGAASAEPLPALRHLGCSVEDMGSLPAAPEGARRALRKAGALHDMVIVAGIPDAEAERVGAAVEAEGEVCAWSRALAPGKPFLFGKVGSADFFGLPDSPAAARETFDALARPFILACQGVASSATA